MINDHLALSLLYMLTAIFFEQCKMDDFFIDLNNEAQGVGVGEDSCAQQIQFQMRQLSDEDPKIHYESLGSHQG